MRSQPEVFVWYVTAFLTTLLTGGIVLLFSLAGCAFTNPNTIGIRWTGNAVELFQEPGGEEDEDGNKVATTEFTDQGLGLVDRAVAVLFSEDEETEEVVEEVPVDDVD